MSEHLLKIMLGELQSVRIVCRGKKSDGLACGAVIELPLDRVASAFALDSKKGCACPICATEFNVYDASGTPSNPFKPLADAMSVFEKLKERVEVQFVIPDKQQK